MQDRNSTREFREKISERLSTLSLKETLEAKSTTPTRTHTTPARPHTISGPILSPPPPPPVSIKINLRTITNQRGMTSIVQKYAQTRVV